MRARRSTFSPLSPPTLLNDIGFDRKSYSSGFSNPKTPVDEAKHAKSRLGLGIPEAPFNPDSSPIRSPGGDKLARAEKGEALKNTPNLAQGIEQKLWKYTASGSIVKRWLLEIISWLLSALCMTAIIVILFALNNRPVPTSWPMNLTLNAYVAILSKIASAALLLPASEALGQLKWSWFQGDSKKMWDFEIFDNASRGPWGSFLLLIRTKGRTLAALGAAVTIFAMALDPFFQQLVRYPQRWEIQPQNSSIPRVRWYEPDYNRVIKQNGQKIISSDLDIKPVVDKFFLDLGIPQVQVGNGTRAEIPVACPTSNCTWEPYETLSVCSECADIADMLEFACLVANLDWVQNATSYVPYDNGTMCGWFLNATSAKPILMSGYQADPVTNQSSGEILLTRTLPLVTNINRRSLFSGSISFKHVRNPITDFLVVSAADGPDRERILNSIFRHQRPRALECVLSWCVQTIESSYYQGTYTETIKNRFTNTSTGPWPWTTIMVRENTAVYEYNQNITVDLHEGGEQGNDSSYGASNETAFHVLTIFDDYLPSYTTTGTNTSETYLKYMTYETSPVRLETPKNPWSAPSNMTHHVERLATTMTNMLRQLSVDKITGKSFSEETFIEVRWLWLSLPVGLLVLTLIFLVATVIRTSKEMGGVGVWKNSSIATLLYGLPDEMQQKITTSQTESTPRTKAKELNVKMVPSRGWRISGNLLSPIARKSKPQPQPGWI